MKLHIFASGLLLAVSFTACSGEKKETTEKEGVETVLPSLPNEVTVMPLKKQVFNHELISNGKVTAQDLCRPVFSYLGSGGEYLGKERGYSAERSKNSPIGFV